MHEVLTGENIKEKCDDESVEMAHQLRRLGEKQFSMNLPYKEFEEKYGNFDSPTSLYKYLSMRIRPFYWSHQNLLQSQGYFQEGYDMLKKIKGVDDPETKEYKELCVSFISWETATAHVEETLWILTFLIPLLIIMVPAISGLHWKSLGVALIIIAAVLVWRIISIFFYFFMAKWHYERTIQ